MKFALVTCLVSGVSSLHAETVFADIKVTADFPGGSAIVKSIDANTGVIHIVPQVQSERGWPCWWYLKVDGVKVDQSITLKLTASSDAFRPGRVLSADWSQPDRAAISVDNVTWTQTAKCQKQGGGATYTIKAPAESFWLAWGPPFLPSHADEALKSAVDLRRVSTVYYVPIMDVDNAALGAGGKDAVPRDHNRDWDDKPHYPEVAAAQARILQLNADQRFDVFVDLHNPGGNERRPYFFGPINLNKLPAVQQQNHARWLAISKEAISGPLPLEPRYKFATYVRTEEERNRMSANWVRNHTADHVLSTTLETVWNTPHSTQQGYMTVGAQLGRAVSRYLESSPREQGK